MKYGLIIYSLLLAVISCSKPATDEAWVETSEAQQQDTVKQLVHLLERDVTVADYFEYMDSVASVYDSLLPYSIDEYQLVHANDWLIDTLACTDYYFQMGQGRFVYDQTAEVVLREGDLLKIPKADRVAAVQKRLAGITIDLNIPEFTIRILEADTVLDAFPVRVGRNEIKYLAMAGREVDLRTHAGEGTIYRINRNAVYTNPADNHVYERTRRDDGRVTKLPRLPWLEPEINGTRYGQLIHPTTNPATLGRASSNGCVGMKEADLWRLYYFAPIGTKVRFRMDHEIIGVDGDTTRLELVYPPSRLRRPTKDQTLAALAEECACDCAYFFPEIDGMISR